MKINGLTNTRIDPNSIKNMTSEERLEYAKLGMMGKLNTTVRHLELSQVDKLILAQELFLEVKRETAEYVEETNRILEEVKSITSDIDAID